MITILDAMQDRHLFAQHFRDPATWQAWRAFLASLFGLELDKAQRRLFASCTGRENPPTAPVSEAWLVVGRRGGKSFILALIAVYLACFKDWKPHLGPGERATVMVIAADRKQSRVIIRYVKGLLSSVPMLARMVQAERAEAIDLTNRVTIEVHTASYRTTRGYSIAAALCDEIAFWPTDESATPDTEILTALRPGMASVPGSMLLCASSPYARRGALWNAFRRHYGKDGDVLVWRAPTRTMNPGIPQNLIDQALDDDPAHAAAEWLAEFRSDIETFISREAVEACVVLGTYERPAVPGVAYYAFADPSGGSGDSFVLAIGHKQDDVAVVDCVREVRSPFSPDSVVKEFAAVLKSYGIFDVIGDRYAGEWPREGFAKYGVSYLPAQKPKSDLYRDLLPVINSRRIDLLEHPRLTAQIIGLERRTARGGRDSIDHAPGAHDDCANAVAGLVSSLTRSGSYDISLSWVS
jgi:hypothetical protein